MATIRIADMAHLLAPALLLLRGANAQVYDYYGESNFGGYGAAFNERVGPYAANSTRFLKEIASSNATGLFKIPGYDVSKPYPGSPIDGWTLSLALLDFSKEGITSSYYSSNGTLESETSDAMIGYSMQIKAPDSLLQPNPDDTNTKIVKTDPSWGMCLWGFGGPSPLHKERYNNPSNKPLAEDGSCVGFLSDACIAALEKATHDAWSIPDPDSKYKGYFGSPVTCESLDLPGECGEYGPGNAGGDLPSYGGVPVRYLNGSVTTSDGWEFVRDKGRLYNSTRDLQEYWDSMVVNYWVFVTALVNATVDANVSEYERGALSRVHCVAPNGEGTGKGFTFSGVVSANVKDNNTAAGGGGGGNGTGKGGDGSGAGVVSPVGWLISVSLMLPLVLGISV